MSDENMKNPHCAKCQYRELTNMHVCNYLLLHVEAYPDLPIGSHRRGCSVSDCQHWQDPPMPKRKGGLMLFGNRLSAEGAKAAAEKKKELSEKREQQRMELYKQGLTDGEIGKLTNCAASTIKGWRLAHKLPANSDQRKNNCCHVTAMSAEERADKKRQRNIRNEARKRGMTAAEYIDQKLRHEVERAEKWKRVVQLHSMGLNDLEISQQVGFHQQTIRNFRKRNGMKANITRRKPGYGEMLYGQICREAPKKEDGKGN